MAFTLIFYAKTGAVNRYAVCFSRIIQTLDMQQVVMRQIATLKKEILKWTSDSREILGEIVSQPTDLDLMELESKKKSNKNYPPTMAYSR